MTFNYSNQGVEGGGNHAQAHIGAPETAGQAPGEPAPLKKKSFSKKQKMLLPVGALALALLVGGGAVAVYGKKSGYSALTAEMQQRVAALPVMGEKEPPATPQVPQSVAAAPEPMVNEQRASNEQDEADDAPVAPSYPGQAQLAPSYPQATVASPSPQHPSAPSPVVNAMPAQAPVASQVPAPAPAQSQPQPQYTQVAAPAQPRLVESGPGAGLPVHIVKPSIADGTETKLRMVIEGMRADLDKIAAESAEYSKQIAAKKAELEKLNAKLAETRRDLNIFDKQADAAQREIDRAEERRLEAERKAKLTAQRQAEKEAAAAALASAIAAEKEAAAAAAAAAKQRAAAAAAAAAAGAAMPQASDKPRVIPPAVAQPINMPPVNTKTQPTGSVSSPVASKAITQAAAPVPAMAPVERPVVAGILSDGVVMPNGDVVEVGKRSRRLGGRLTGVLPSSGAIEVEGVVRYVTISN